MYYSSTMSQELINTLKKIIDALDGLKTNEIDTILTAVQTNVKYESFFKKKAE